MRRRKRGLLVWLTNHLTYEQKYTLAGAVRGIGYFIFWIALLVLVMNQISLITAQIRSSESFQPMRQLYQSVIKEMNQPGSNNRITEQIQSLLAREHTNENNEIYTSLKQVQQTWSAIENKEFADEAGLMSLFQTLTRSIRQAMAMKTDQAILDMDPVNIGYLLLENIKRRLRDSQSSIWQAIVITERAMANGELTTQDREKLLTLAQYLKRTGEVTYEELNKVKTQLELTANFEDMGRDLSIRMNQYQLSVEEFVEALETGYLNVTEDTVFFPFVDGTLVMGNTFALRELITEQLNDILHEQINALWTKMIYVFSLGILFTFIGSYLGVHFVYEAIKSFHQLEIGTRKLTSGDLSVRVPIIYVEEIGKATMAFNRMADHLGKLIHQQRYLFEATRKLAEGDFSVRVKVDEDADEEIKQVSHSFNGMAQTFEEIVRQLHRLGINLTSSANEIASASKKHEDLIIEQGEATREISITASEISTTAKDFAITINDVSQVAEQSSNLASDGQDSLIAMEKIMRQMVSASSNISDKLAILNEKAGNITKIITAITNVARQTNLLSLNAAIEAEKTGVFSRDFSVIAREIRRLADQTAVATLDIETIVNEIMNAVSSCVTGVEDFTKQIQFGVDKVVVVGEQLGQIIVQVQALAYRFEAVNEGMQEQSQSAEKINEAMVQLSHAASTTTESIQYFSQTIDQLSHASQGLQQTIENISVSEKKR